MREKFQEPVNLEKLKNMDIALLHHHHDKQKLRRILKEMLVLGPPRISAVWVEHLSAWAALEGCHRLRAAKILGYTPIILEVPRSATLFCNDALVNDVCTQDDVTVNDFCLEITGSPIFKF